MLTAQAWQLGITAGSNLHLLVLPTLDASIKDRRAFEQLLGAWRTEPCVSKLSPVDYLEAVTVQASEVGNFFVAGHLLGMVLASNASVSVRR